MSSPRHLLDPAHTDPKRLKKERERARELRATGWWKALVARGECHYCHGKFPPKSLTLDHVIPLARGGTSVRGNVVPACAGCNRDKKLDTPVDALFRQLETERAARAGTESPSGTDEENSSEREEP